MSDEVLASQLEYYRRRAREYDATAYGDIAAARARIARLIAQLQPTGAVLEIACGTGLWTEALARTTDTLTAIDAAPEALEIARDRVRFTNVRFEVADIFSWEAAERFDVIFFSAWLSHVPTSHFAQFWQLLRNLLTERGRVLFVDEHIEERGKESYVSGEIVERQLQDGSRYRVVKNFIDPQQLQQQLRELNWDFWVQRDNDAWVWVYGEARPVEQVRTRVV